MTPNLSVIGAAFTARTLGRKRFIGPGLLGAHKRRARITFAWRCLLIALSCFCFGMRREDTRSTRGRRCRHRVIVILSVVEGCALGDPHPMRLIRCWHESRYDHGPWHVNELPGQRKNYPKRSHRRIRDLRMKISKWKDEENWELVLGCSKNHFVLFGKNERGFWSQDVSRDHQLSNSSNFSVGSKRNYFPDNTIIFFFWILVSYFGIEWIIYSNW